MQTSPACRPPIVTSLSESARPHALWLRYDKPSLDSAMRSAEGHARFFDPVLTWESTADGCHALFDSQGRIVASIVPEREPPAEMPDAVVQARFAEMGIGS